MKKVFLYAAAGLMLASCASDEIVDITHGGNRPSDVKTINFTTSQKNITRAYSPLQEKGHYNFGVFAYKSTDLVNPVMPNYLVGYYDEEKAYLNSGTSTWGDPSGLEDGKSYWMYEGMGNAEYNGTYAGGALTPAYTSNNANQYLKYWDSSAEYTCFYAYAPYINGAGTATYVDGTAQAATGADTYVLTIPNGTLTDGYDDESLAEYMYASAKVAKADYGHDVALQFHRLNAKVNIKFWEDIPGWKVRILDLSSKAEGVQAAASIKDGTSGSYGYTAGKYYIKNGVKIQFADGASTGMKQFAGTTATNTTTLKFKSPTVAKIGENRYEASASATTYYAIPKGSDADVLKNDTKDLTQTQPVDDDLALTGFTFHVSYELTAEDTGEHIVVKNATVHVPYTYCNWVANTHYTYIFKITTNSNGNTGGTDDDADPTDPEVPTVQSLYPIVFDNCTVEEWQENESEWEITKGTSAAYHDIQLSTYSLVKGKIEVTVTDNDTHAGHAIDYKKIAVTGPAGADMNKVTYAFGTKTITVASGATAGVYTVTYTCDAPAAAQATHPVTWTEHFVVGNEYKITTALSEVATNGIADAKLVFTATKDGSNVTGEAVEAGQIAVDYPDNFTDAQKANVKVDNTGRVLVKKNATPGVYKLVYTVDEGSKIKVAEALFSVVDKSFILSQTVVFNNVDGTTLTASQEADADHVYTAPAGFTVSGNTIFVPNNTEEGNYTVTYTVNGGTKSEVKYNQTFEVRNTHSVVVSKNAISKSEGTSQDSDYSDDTNSITTKINGVNTTTNLSSQLSIVKADKTATAAGDFKITYRSNNGKYALAVKRSVEPGTYYVKFVNTVAGADKAEYAEFVVKE